MNNLWIAPLLFGWTYLVGLPIARLLSRDRAERAWLACAFGFAALVLLATGLAFAGFLSTGPILGCLLGGAILSGAVVVFGSKGLTVEAAATGTDAPRILVRLSLALVVLVGAHSLLCALTPEVRSDPIRYHINLANQYAVRGGIEPLRETVWWTIPQYAECTYALGIVLCNETLSKLLHWWAGAISTLGVFAMTRRAFGKTSAYWALLLWATTPIVTYEATTTYVELFLVVWIQVAVWFAVRALEASSSKASVLFLSCSGLFVGMAFGTKYTALGVQGVPWILFVVLAWFRWGRKSVKATLSYSLPFFAIGLADSFWLVRNLWNTGNPFYPLYNRFLGLTEGYDRGAELYFLTVWPGERLLSWSHYYYKAYGSIDAGYNFPLVFLWAVPAYFLLRRRRGEGDRFSTDGWLGFCLLSLGAYLFLTGNMDARFWLPSLATLMPFLGDGMSFLFSLVGGDRGRRAGILGVGLLCAFNYAGQRANFFYDFKESPWPILREEARIEYFRERERGDPLGHVFEKLIPEGETVYRLPFPARVRAILPVSESVPGPDGKQYVSNFVPLKDPFMKSERRPEDFLDAAREAGVEYIALPFESDPVPEIFWEMARRVGEKVEGGEGRLLRIPQR